MADWRDLIKASDAGKFFPDAAARVIEKEDAQGAGLGVEAMVSAGDSEHPPTDGESGTL